MFLDYFKKKKEDGIKSDNMFQQFRYLRKVYLYLFSHEFESTNVEEYMKMVSDGSDNQSDPGICPHCGEVIFFCLFCFCISVVFNYYIQGSFISTISISTNQRWYELLIIKVV